MDSRADSTETKSHHGVFLLAEEKFDFDVSLSPDSSTGDEDEVFVGPISVSDSPRLLDGDAQLSWRPLSAEQQESVCREANRLVEQLQSDETSRRHHDDRTVTADVCDELREGFVQDAVGKRAALSQPTNKLSPIKRQTFCLQDTPVKQLPPAVQRHLLKANGSVTSMAVSTRSAAQRSTPSPVRASRTRPRESLRGKAERGIGIVPPSKSAAPKTSCSNGKKKVVAEMSRLQPQSKVVANSRTRAYARSSGRTVSCEDLLSSTSVSSDICDASFNSSLPVRRTVAPPIKSAQRNLSAGRVAPTPSRTVMDRTSSSSSSVSSFNSSLSTSPVWKGKMTSSLNASISGSSDQVPASVARTASATKPPRSIVSAAARQPPSSAAAGRRSLLVQARKLSDTEHTARSTQPKKVESGIPTPLCMTPPKRSMERTSSVPSSKLKAIAHTPRTPTPTRPSRGVSSPGTSNFVKPKRMTSSVFVDSPWKQSVPTVDDCLPPSAGVKKLLQVKAPRPSALPTPLRGRASNTMAAVGLQRPAVLASNSTSAKRARGCSPSPTKQEEDTFHLPDIQPFCLEEEHLDAPPFAEQSESTESRQLDPNGSDSSKNLDEPPSAEGAEKQEVLLLDLPAPTLQPQEKLLIDLTNTPDLIHTRTACSAAQLIDLSSPLIKWSPEDKKTNQTDEVPLINLSF